VTRNVFSYGLPASQLPSLRISIIWLRFLDTYRALCIAPVAEILALFEELRLNY
jgi:hypothetical protein